MLLSHSASYWYSTLYCTNERFIVSFIPHGIRSECVEGSLKYSGVFTDQSIVVSSSYYYTVSYGKGFDFYADEPVLWLKTALIGILSALRFFPTTNNIQRFIVARNKNGEFSEMNEEALLVSRMQSVLDAELTALVSIPLPATIMSPGIGYNDSILWPAEATGAALLFAGLEKVCEGGATRFQG
jgi:uncharacterized membrane protein